MHENYAMLVKQPQAQNSPALNKSLKYCSFSTCLYIPEFGFLMQIQRFYSCHNQVKTEGDIPHQ